MQIGALIAQLSLVQLAPTGMGVPAVPSLIDAHLELNGVELSASPIRKSAKMVITGME